MKRVSLSCDKERELLQQLIFNWYSLYSLYQIQILKAEVTVRVVDMMVSNTVFKISETLHILKSLLFFPPLIMAISDSNNLFFSL